MTIYNDSLTSIIGGMGDPFRDKLAASNYQMTHLTDMQLQSAFETSWMVRKAVTIPAHDATRKWRDWQGESKDTQAIETLEKQLGLQAKMRQAKVLARLWGGAAIVIGDGASDPTEPLDVERFKKNGLKYLSVLPRRELAARELDRDPAAITFGRPKGYNFASLDNLVDFHPSRLVLQYGSEQADPWTATGPNYGWGDSIVTAIWEAMRQGDSVLHNVASLVFEANIDVMKFPDLMAMASQPEYEAKFLKRTTLAATGKSINRTLVMDANEEYERKSASFGTLDKIIDQFLRVCAGAADIPMTRFMAQSPAGLSATGEGDMKNYYDMVESVQELEIGPALHTLDECLIRSALGSRPEEISYVWRPLEQMSEKDLAEIGSKHAETASKLIMAGTHTGEEMRIVTTTALTDGGVFPNLAATVAESDSAADFDLGSNDDVTTDAAPRTLYVSRKVLNVKAIKDWAESQGLTVTIPDDELHVTIIYSKALVDWMKIGEAWNDEVTVQAGGPRIMERFNDALVLSFASSCLKWRNEHMVDCGASTDYPDYQPHVTLSYGENQEISLDDIEPYQGEIKLGPEIFKEINPDWQAKAGG